MTAPEFFRPHPVRALHAAPEGLSIEADSDERTALAERFGLVSLDALSADLTMQREETGLMVRGTVRAAVQQACVVTGDPVASDIDETFALRFLRFTHAGLCLDQAGILLFRGAEGTLS